MRKSMSKLMDMLPAIPHAFITMLDACHNMLSMSCARIQIVHNWVHLQDPNQEHLLWEGLSVESSETQSRSFRNEIERGVLRIMWSTKRQRVYKPLDGHPSESNNFTWKYGKTNNDNWIYIRISVKFRRIPPTLQYAGAIYHQQKP